MQSAQSSATQTIGHPAWGLASLAVAALVATAILLGLPYLFGHLLEIPAFAAMAPATLESLFTLCCFGLLGGFGILAVRFSMLSVPFSAHGPALVATGLGIGAIGLAVSVALCAIAGTAQQGMAENGGGAGLLLLETVLLVIQSGAEELYFRAWLQKDLERRWGIWPALAVTATLFAALHFVAAASEPLTFVTMLLGGVLFGLSYWKSGSFLLPWAIHFSWNWAEEIGFGLTPNPGTGTFGAIVDLDLVGPVWWGGGGEGLNASLSSIVVLIALIAAVAAWPSRSADAVRFRKIPARG